MKKTPEAKTHSLDDEQVITRRRMIGLAALSLGAVAVAGTAHPARASEDGAPDTDQTESDPDKASEKDTHSEDPDMVNTDTSGEGAEDKTEGDSDKT